ncbi:hypothetical protein, conserved [Eimeria praecox]|uniref:Uncharacterized protein n=1 Tax=Eimeria praecox TaxID=51316 RepID=U6GCM4_9EIME|nr:hypothetical protein, conserved [Eimeria praecox]
MVRIASRRALAPVVFAALLWIGTAYPARGEETEDVVGDSVIGEEPASASEAAERAEAAATAAAAAASEAEAAGSEEGLGIQASKWELTKMVPMLIELQKNVHDHYCFIRIMNMNVLVQIRVYRQLNDTS